MQFTALFTTTQDLTDAAKALYQLETRPTAAALESARIRLLDAMRHHCLTKDRELLAMLRESEDCAHQAMARRTTEQDLEWRQRMLDHFVAWPLRKIHADPHGHRAAAHLHAHPAARAAIAADGRDLIRRLTDDFNPSRHHRRVHVLLP